MRAQVSQLLVESIMGNTAAQNTAARRSLRRRPSRRGMPPWGPAARTPTPSSYWTSRRPYGTLPALRQVYLAFYMRARVHCGSMCGQRTTLEQGDVGCAYPRGSGGLRPRYPLPPRQSMIPVHLCCARELCTGGRGGSGDTQCHQHCHNQQQHQQQQGRSATAELGREGTVWMLTARDYLHARTSIVRTAPTLDAAGNRPPPPPPHGLIPIPIPCHPPLAYEGMGSLS